MNKIDKIAAIYLLFTQYSFDYEIISRLCTFGETSKGNNPFKTSHC